jgi:small subunit ribosomal protein S20
VAAGWQALRPKSSFGFSSLTLKSATANVVRQLDIAARAAHLCGYHRSQKNSGDQFVPNIASAKKNMRKSRAAAIRNRAQRSALRTALKRASTGGNADDKLSAVKLLDRASRKGLIHKNAAARYKSRLAKAATN